MRKLEGAGIVVTRPADAEDRLARLLAAEGARVLAFPALEIVPLDARTPTGEFAAALFASPTAARLGVPRLRAKLPSQILAPGRGTRAVLAEAGIADVIAPPTGAGLAALFAALAPDFLAGQRLLFVCGEPLNRASLAALAARGAEVTPFPVYARRATRDPRPLAGWIRSGEADAIMASSIAAVTALGTCLGDDVCGIGWIASSRRVANAVERAGAKLLAVANSAEAGDMAEAAIHWWQPGRSHERA